MQTKMELSLEQMGVSYEVSIVIDSVMLAQPSLATQGLSKGYCFISHGDYMHFYRLSHSELVDIEKVAVCSSLRSLKTKCTIESRANKDHP
ncbi:hypothetical protein Tco_0279002 [Tanacetum coccineum]